jgi:hypothetical protein
MTKDEAKKAVESLKNNNSSPALNTRNKTKK